MPPRGGSEGADGAGFAHFPLSVAGSGLCWGSPGSGKRLLGDLINSRVGMVHGMCSLEKGSGSEGAGSGGVTALL